MVWTSQADVSALRRPTAPCSAVARDQQLREPGAVIHPTSSCGKPTSALLEQTRIRGAPDEPDAESGDRQSHCT